MAKIIGHGAPTSKTFGVLGQEYFDKDSNKVYTCTKVTHKTAYRAGEADAEYEWTVIGNDPFEVKKEIITIVPEQSVTSEYSQDTPVGTVCMNRFPKTMDLIDGAKYIVCINNKNYEVTAKEVMGLVVIGDPFLYGAPVDSTGEPFFFMVMHEDPTQYVFVWKAEFGTTVTTSIICEQEIFEKIDYKFMPEGYPKVEKKIVEIVPEQSVTGTKVSDTRYKTTWDAIDFSMDKNYKVVVNGETYPVAVGESIKGTSLNDYDDSFTIISNGEIAWNSEYGGTVTFAIYEYIEYVKQIDTKFIPPMHRYVEFTGWFDGSVYSMDYCSVPFDELAEWLYGEFNYRCVLMLGSNESDKIIFINEIEISAEDGSIRFHWDNGTIIYTADSLSAVAK